MIGIDLSWTWTTTSPLHCGAGLSQPGRADRLVQTDANGNPVLVGDAVKGTLRMSAEQVLAWLGYEAPYADPEYTGPAEPKHPLLAVLFGGAGEQHFEAGELQDPTNVRRSVTASTAVDRLTGCADDNTLRQVETVAPGTCFRCGVRVWLPDEADELVDPAVTLLLAALAATESVGARAGVGWGRMDVSGVEVSYSGSTAGKIDSQAALCPKRLAGLKKSIDLSLPATATIPATSHQEDVEVHANGEGAAASTTPPELDWYCLTLRLVEPTCLGSRQDVSNQVATHDSVPATVLRGAMRGAWLRKGVSEKDVLPLIGPASRWTPALPAAAGVPCFPTPRSFATEKEGDGSVLFDGLVAGTGETGNSGKPAQWRPPAERWMMWTSEDKVAPLRERVPKEVRMHVARDYRTGSKRTGALFSREALRPGDAGRTFVAYVGLPRGCQVTWPDEVFLGKRRSAGNGRATVVAKKLPGVDRPWPQSWFGNVAAGNDVFVQLLSPAVVRDPDGFPLQSLGIEDWKRILRAAEEQPADGLDGCAVVRYTAVVAVAGWMGPWGHGRSAVTCIAAGSVWRLACKNDTSAPAVRDRLRGLAQRGLGERCYEGFGWIAVDPPWLGQETVPIVTRTAGTDSEKAAGRVQPWPGCEDLSREDLGGAIAALAKAGKLTSELRRPLQELATRARRDTRAEVMKYCEKMAARTPKAHQWEHLKTGKPARKYLDSYADEACKAGDPLFRFALEALLIRVTPEREAR